MNDRKGSKYKKFEFGNSFVGKIRISHAIGSYNYGVSSVDFEEEFKYEDSK